MASSSVFHFRQFSIHQDKCAMKVGTDGVLLGAWTEIPVPAKPGDGTGKILDIGTGTGVIALMLAQKLKAIPAGFIIDAIDTDEASCVQATENCSAFMQGDKVRIFQQSLQQFAYTAEKNAYHLIVSNPPFFINSLKSPKPSRNTARHADAAALSHITLASIVKKLLAPDGIFCLILPFAEGELFMQEALKHNLFCEKRTKVFSKPGKSCARMLMQFGNFKKSRVENELMIETGEKLNDFTDEYRLLTEDFYLWETKK